MQYQPGTSKSSLHTEYVDGEMWGWASFKGGDDVRPFGVNTPRTGYSISLITELQRSRKVGML